VAGAGPPAAVDGARRRGVSKTRARDWRDLYPYVSWFTVECAAMRHGVRDGWNHPPRKPNGDPMFAKTFILALVLAGTSLAFVAEASARPTSSPSGWQDRGDTTPQERHDPTNTNGG
jgi:hypothetical protein